MTNIKDPQYDKWRRIVANFISAINMYAWLQRMIKTEAHLRCEQIFFSADGCWWRGRQWQTGVALVLGGRRAYLATRHSC